MTDIGGVEVWRGDGISGIAVIARFCWRCPMSQTMGPFPNPAHRKPDVQRYRGWLSDMTSGLHPQPALLELDQTHESEAHAGRKGVFEAE
jgi:hypothetical protein